MRQIDQHPETGPETGASDPVVFVVDDDASTLELLSEVAEESGWVARGFARLGEFESALRGRRPDLVILDDDLPDGRGGDLARELRADGSLHGVPVLVCTAAHPVRQAEIRAWAPVISKPFDLGQVERFLQSATGGRPRMRDQAAG